MCKSGTAKGEKYTPLVSVIMPTKNRASLLARAIESVLSQTYKNIELIVVNDGSTDTTEELLSDLSNRESRLIIINSPVSEGACFARNRAIELSSGEYVTGIDDDDLFTPERIENFLAHYDDRYSFLCDYRVLVPSGGLNRYIREVGKEKIIDLESIKRSNLVGNQIFVERSKLDVEHIYDPGMPSWQDYDLWFRLIRDYGPALKLDSHTYLLDSVSAANRISSSDLASVGYSQFVEKYGSDLSKSDRANLKVADLFNRRVKLSLFASLRLFRTFYSARKSISLYMLTHCPRLYGFVTRVFVSLYGKRAK